MIEGAVERLFHPGIDLNGLALEQFIDHPSTISTVEAFSKGFSGLEGFIHDRMTVHH
jgi:hypothetical protein